jgi:hypothetical protein
VASAALLALCSSTASAQQVGSFAQLQLLVKPGDRIVVIDSAQQAVRGRIAMLSDSVLQLTLEDKSREFAEADVAEIRQRRSDPVSNGARVGAWVGGGIGGALMATICIAEPPDCGWGVAAAATYLALGTGVGAGIDALIERDQTIYRNPGQKSAGGLRVAPVFFGRRHGVSLALVF